MSHHGELGLVFTGQGTKIDKSWLGDQGFRTIADQMSEAMGPSVDIFHQLKGFDSNPPKTTLENHTLIAGVVGYALFRLQTYQSEFIATTGHSLGLVFSPQLFGFYENGIHQMGQVVYKRGSILTDAQKSKETSGVMYSLNLKDPQGFKTVNELVVQHNLTLDGDKPDDLWVACYNAEGDKGTFVTLTARTDTDVQKIFDNIGVVKLLPIATGAHSPLVEGAAKQFTQYLGEQTDHLSDLNKNGAVFVSDHNTRGSQILYTRDRTGIIAQLGSLDAPVQFQKSIQTMINRLAVKKIILVGSSSLSTFIKRMPEKVEVVSIDTPQALDAFETSLSNLL